jgi:1-acyl-sn-glycerol-3-phosphate acyltransferase
MEPSPAGYSVLRPVARFLIGLFYRRVDVVGIENVPKEGPLIVAANHHNSLVDPMLLVAVIPRHLRTLANAPLFHHPLVGPFLRLMGGLPVHRRQEAGDDPAKNAQLFAATTATLRAGGAILIFPEGRTQPEPVLLELRTGAARMLLAAEGPEGPRVTLLPVGLVFQEPGTFREARALVKIGAPIDTSDPATSGDQAARVLTGRLRQALGAQIIEAIDRHTLFLLGVAEEVWSLEAGGVPQEGVMRVAWMQGATRAYAWLLEHEPARTQALLGGLEAYSKELREVGLSSAQLDNAYPASVVVRFVLREGFALFVGTPLALVGVAVHWIPYQATGAVVKRLQRTDEEEATDKIFAGLVLFPIAWLLELALAYALGGRLAALVVALSLLPLGFFAIAWRDRLGHVAREAQAFLQFLRDRGVAGRLREKRRALGAELTALSALAISEPLSAREAK